MSDNEGGSSGARAPWFIYAARTDSALTRQGSVPVKGASASPRALLAVQEPAARGAVCPQSKAICHQSSQSSQSSRLRLLLRPRLRLRFWHRLRPSVCSINDSEHLP